MFIKTKDSKSIAGTTSFFICVLCCICITGNFLFSQWQPDVRLTNDPAVSWTALQSWAVAANGGIVHVVWSDTRDSNYEIYYKRSTDEGFSWGMDTRLTNAIDDSYNPSVSVSGMFVHVVWHDDRNGNREIYYKRSTNGGLTWGADIRLTNDPYISYSPSFSVCGSILHVAWQDTRNGPYGYSEIYYKRSTDNGTNWGADTRLTNDSAESLFSSISSSGCNVHVVWEDLRDGYNDGNWEIYYKRSTNGGLSWGTDTRLTYNTANSYFPSIYALGTDVHVVWDDLRDGNEEIYYKRSLNNGINWGSDIRLTNDPFVSKYPNISGSGNNVHIVWQDLRTSNQYKIYYKNSTNGGLNWGGDLLLSPSVNLQQNPSSAVSGTSVNVVWSDNRTGDYEIFYKRELTVNASPTYTLSGRVTFSDNGQPVNTGNVKALRYNRVTNNFIIVDSTIILPGGIYTLPRVPQDTIYIMYYQNDEAIPQFVPTYYRSTINWQQAETIYPTQNLVNIDGQVFRINNDGSSILHISGTCFTQNDLSVSVLGDVIVYAKIGNEFKNYGISDENGIYTASKLPPGGYTLFAYRIGYDYLTRNATLSGNNIDTLNFYFSPPIGINKISEEIPVQFNLYQNYPNPFNPTTKIIFDIPGFKGEVKNDMFTELKIYDILGKEIAILVNEHLKPGIYEAVWNAVNYSSGLYFYRLKTGNFIQSKKMVLLK